jgi:hypothetical protein
MKFLKMILIAGALFAAANAQVDTTQKHYWMMTYFINSEETDGARLAFSSDSTGIKWEYYNNQTPILVPTVTGGLMRDPMIEFDSTYNKFNFVWTAAWTGTLIGWDTSSNLTKWGPQVALTIGASISNCYCCWAPEIFWDDIKGEWMILWASSQSSGGDKAIYYCDIPGQDFTKFTAPQILFYPEFTVIDADMMKLGPNSYVMDFKDERNSTGATQSKNVHLVFSTSPSGPFKGPNLYKNGTDTTMSLACTNDAIEECEGPTLVYQGGMYHLFVDPFNSFSSTYRMVEARNIDTMLSPWTQSATLTEGTGTAAFEYNHSNVIQVPRRFVMNLLYGQALPTPPAAPLLTSPTNGAKGQTGATTMSWASSTGATGYNVQFSTSSTFAATVYGSMGGVATTSLAPGLPTTVGTYYWRVNAANANAGAGGWSAVWSFSMSATSVIPGTAAVAKATDFSVANGVLSYSVRQAGAVEITLKDMLGRTTPVLNRSQGVGQYSIPLNGYNLAAGRYIVRFRAAGVEESSAIVLTR